MRRLLLAAVVALLPVLPVVTVVPAAGTPVAGAVAAAPAGASGRMVDLVRWAGGTRLERGALAGARLADGRVALGRGVRTRRYAGRSFDAGRWTSPWVRPGFRLTRLVASWEARTPGDSWVEVSVRGRSRGRVGSWDVLGRWTSGDRHLHRTTVSGQSDDLGSVDVDTWLTRGAGAWQLRVALLRRVGARSPAPSVGSLGAVVSRGAAAERRTSKPGVGRGIDLKVPRYSQMAHRGSYPQWGGGGEAWCSPTSTSMVLGYYEALPPRRSWAWVDDDQVDPWVVVAARRTYDQQYAGTGNWPFNTAFAATQTGRAFVTRLRSLREAERYVAAGIPLVASIAFGPGELDGAPISSTDGHLLVIRGFTRAGDVIVNDPAAATRRGVRRVYDRGQFEDAWLPTTQGTTYVVTDRHHPLPG